MKQIRNAIPLILATTLVVPHTAWSFSDSDNDFLNATNDYAYDYSPEPAEVEAFLGGGIGYFRIDDEDYLNENEQLEDDRKSWKVFGGFDLGRALAIELAYIDFGRLNEEQASVEATGWTIAGIIALPITENFSPYGKAGQLYWDADFTLGPTTISADGNDFFFGLGGRFSLNDWSDIRLEYERFTMDDTDVDMASINLQFRF
ncbi:MAG: outer membrane beta-barrel protein [Aquisalimonadaceae bacterium]